MTTEDRKFVRTVAAAFLVFAAFFAWRDKPTVAWVALSLAVALVVLRFVAPAAVAPVRRTWMRGAHAMSRITTPIILGIVYYLVLTPIGVARRLMGRSSIKPVPTNGSWWVTRTDGARPREDMNRQF